MAMCGTKDLKIRFRASLALPSNEGIGDFPTWLPVEKTELLSILAGEDRPFGDNDLESRRVDVEENREETESDALE
jgi:hypothetical protein